MAPFFAWFVPEAISRTKRGEKAFILTVTTRYWALVLLAGCNVWILLPIVWATIFPSLPFEPGNMALLLAGSILFALGNPVSIGVLAPGRTFLSPTLASAALAVGLSSASGLGIVFGEHGVMLGRLAGFAAYVAFFGWATQRILEMQYPWRLYATMALSALLVCLVGQVGGATPAEIAAKLVLLNGTALAVLLAVQHRWKRLA
jgi:hypothetical protein